MFYISGGSSLPFKFSEASQEPTLQAGLAKDSSLRPAMQILTNFFLLPDLFESLVGRLRQELLIG